MHKLLSQPYRAEGLLGSLSDRELHVFTLIAAEHGTGQIAEELGISRKTVESHCEHIKQKLGYSDAIALKSGARNLLGATNVVWRKESLIRQSGIVAR